MRLYRKWWFGNLYICPMDRSLIHWWKPEGGVQQCVEERSKQKINGEPFALIRRAVRSKEMDMHIAEPTDRVWTLGKDNFNALKNAGYDDLHTSKTHIAIDHFLKKLNLQQLHKRMLDIIIRRRNDNFHKEILGIFMRETSKQAENMWTEQKSSTKLPSRECYRYSAEKGS